MAGAKMVAASAGTALAGTLVGLGPRFALLVGAAVTAAAVVIALTDRRLAGSIARTAEPETRQPAHQYAINDRGEGTKHAAEQGQDGGADRSEATGRMAGA
jgi:hypothetical protein